MVRPHSLVHSRRMLLARVVWAVVALSIAMAAPVKHQVLNLPGWDAPLPSNHYAGFLNITGTQPAEPLSVHRHHSATARYAVPHSLLTQPSPPLLAAV